MTFLSSLQGDYRTLSQDSKKKYPQVKEACERAILKIRSIMDNDTVKLSEEYISELILSSELLDPLVMIAEDGKSSKLCIQCASILQKLIIYGAVSHSQLKTVVSMISNLVEVQDEGIQLKVLQTIMSLISSPKFGLQSELSRLFGFLFRLLASKFASVQNPAAATLRQSTMMLFDKAADRSETQDLEVVKLAESHAFAVFQDLCFICSNDVLRWIPEATVVSKLFALELIEGVLGTHAPLFSQEKRFTSLLHDRVSPMILSLLSENCEFSVVIRSYRVLAVLISMYHQVVAPETEIFVRSILKNFEKDKRGWMRALSLELLRLVCMEPVLLWFLYTKFDAIPEATNPFDNITSAVCHFLQCHFHSALDVSPSSLYQKGKVLEVLGEDIPVVTEGYMSTLAVACIGGLVQCLSCSHAITPTMKPHPQDPGTEILHDMCEIAWPALLASLSVVLAGASSVPILQHILGLMQSFCLSCCVLELAVPRDTLLSYLCKYCLPASHSSAAGAVIQMKNSLCIKTVLNVVHAAGNALGESWTHVLEMVVGLNTAIRPNGEKSGSLDVESVGLLDNIESVFSSSDKLNDKSLLRMLNILISIALRPVMSSSSDDPGRAVPLFRNASLFASRKAVQVACVNSNRLELTWKTLIEFLLKLVKLRDADVRSFALESIKNVSEVALEVSHGESEWLERIVACLNGLMRDEDTNVARDSVVTFLKLLESSGSYFCEGWELVLQSLLPMSLSPNKVVVQSSFQCLQFIRSNFLNVLRKGDLHKFVLTSSAYVHQQCDMNIALAAVESLWNVGDLLAKGESGENSSDELTFQCMWLSLLREMRVSCLDSRPEVRASSIRTLFTTLANHGSILTEDSWIASLENTIIALLIDVLDVAERPPTPSRAPKQDDVVMHFSRNSAEKQWNETKILALDGVCHTLKLYIDVIGKWTFFEGFYKRICALLVSFSKSSSPEVFLASVKGLFDILETHGAFSKLGKSGEVCFRASLDSLDEMAVFLCSKDCIAYSQVYMVRFLEIYSLIYERLSSHFLEEDVRKYIGVLKRLALIPSQSFDPSLPSELQRNVFSAFRGVAPVCSHVQNENQLSEFLIATIMTFVVEEPVGHVFTGGIAAISAVFDDCLKRSCRWQIFQLILTRICDVLQSSDAIQRKKWVYLLPPFMHVSVKGLAAMVREGEADGDVTLAWELTSQCLRVFLTVRMEIWVESIHPEQDATHLVELLDFLRDQLLPLSDYAQDDVRKLFINLLVSLGSLRLEWDEFTLKFSSVSPSHLHVVQGSLMRIQRAAIRHLFGLCSIKASDSSCGAWYASNALPSLLEYAEMILSQYAASYSESASIPLSRSQVEQTAFLLEQLICLKIPKGAITLTNEQEKMWQHARGKEHFHLFILFPKLTETVVSASPPISGLLQTTLKLVGWEFGLIAELPALIQEGI